MSEYQYYEFQALDRRLTEAEMAEVSNLSSRVRPTPTQAVFVYNWGDFRSDPLQVLGRYYDAMLYMANWGTRQLAFRLPKQIVRIDELRQYEYAEFIELHEQAEHVILDLKYWDEDGGGGGWLEGEGTLSQVVSLRDDILRGDYRALYWVHLKIVLAEAAMLEEDEEFFEAPVPPNLSVITRPLEKLIEFYELDPDLVAAAIRNLPQQEQVQRAPDLAEHIDKLPTEEQRALLVRLLNGEQHLDLELRRRLLKLAPQPTGTQSSSPRRSIRALMALADEMKRERKAKERAARATARHKHLEKIAAQKDDLWARVMSLIAQKKTIAYDEAVEILKHLRDLAVSQQQAAGFYERTAGIIAQYPKLPGLHDRMRRAQLLK